jgi:hypothetical protein
MESRGDLPSLSYNVIHETVSDPEKNRVEIFLDHGLL